MNPTGVFESVPPKTKRPQVKGDRNDMSMVRWKRAKEAEKVTELIELDAEESQSKKTGATHRAWARHMKRHHNTLMDWVIYSRSVLMAI